jgi:hypothetical protein
VILLPHLAGVIAGEVGLVVGLGGGDPGILLASRFDAPAILVG